MDPSHSLTQINSSTVNDEQVDSLRSELETKLLENRGEIIYKLGFNADGGENGFNQADYNSSLSTLKSVVASIDADILELVKQTIQNRYVGQYLVRKRFPVDDFIEVRVAVVGNVDAGKSTLLGVLTHGELDNGRGYARQRLFRHKHEIESGRTSSVGNDILGFDNLGNVINKPDHGTVDWVRICAQSSKVITFIDLAGHEKYLKTTVFGMTGHVPDFGMLMIGANAGIIGMTKEHLGLALALSVPVFIVVTKIDMCPPKVLDDNLQLLFRILKSQGCRKVPVIVRNNDEVVLSALNFVSERLCPIFLVSNVNGENLHFLKMFLNLLSCRTEGVDTEPAEFQIDDTYSVPGVGTVISGTCLRGVITLNDNLLLGPDTLGHFLPITIKSIHRKRMNVRQVRSGQTASFALKKVKRSQIRKGMALVSPNLNPQACWEFEGEIVVLHHPTTISSRYQAMVHCGSVRQTASILSMDREFLRTGDKAIVKFKFIKHPEFIRAGQKMVFREGRTKAVGSVLKPLFNTPTTQMRVKASKIQHNLKAKQSGEGGTSAKAEGTQFKDRHHNPLSNSKYNSSRTKKD